METGRPVQVVEAALVHPERQLPVLLRVHDGQGAAGHNSAGEYFGARDPGPEQAALLRVVCEWRGGHNQGVQDGLGGEGGGGEAHGVPDVGGHGGGQAGVDQVLVAVHQSQSVL